MKKYLDHPKIIFMDLEGTLLKKTIHLDNGKVAPSAWTLLAERLGLEALCQEEETKDRWLRNGYKSYMEWMQDTIRIHKEHGLTATLFEEVMNSVEEMPGIREAASTFHSWGAVTAIITGGFKALADRIQRSLKIDHALSGCEYFFNRETGLLDHWNLLPTDYEGKVDFMRLLMKEHRIQKEQSVFIGDAQNDVWMAKKVGISIAFNAHPALQKVSTYVVNQLLGHEDFRAVVDCIESHVMNGANRMLGREKSRGNDKA